MYVCTLYSVRCASQRRNVRNKVYFRKLVYFRDFYGHNELSENDHLGYSVYNSYTIFLFLCVENAQNFAKFSLIKEKKRKKRFLMAVGP